MMKKISTLILTILISTMIVASIFIAFPVTRAQGFAIWPHGSRTVVVGYSGHYVASLGQQGVSPAWSSSNTAVIRVDQKEGFSYAVAPGTAVVTGEYQGLTDTEVVTVIYPEYPVLASIKITPESPILKVRDTQTFTATGYDQYGNIYQYGQYTWTSDNSAVGYFASMQPIKSNLFRANAEGIANINAFAVNKYISGKTTVNVGNYYAITASVEGLTGGTISPSGRVIVSKGDSPEFTITPNEFYLTEDIKVDGASIGTVNVGVNTYTFHNVNQDHTIEAIFTQFPEFEFQDEAIFDLQFEHHESDDNSHLVYDTVPLIGFKGTISREQIVSDIVIAPKTDDVSTVVTFTVTGNDGETGYTTMTIPESAIPYGITPVVYSDRVLLGTQSFLRAAGNFNVHFLIGFSTHEVTIQFINSPFVVPESIFGTAVSLGAAFAAFGVITIRKAKKHKILNIL
jgi:hypothetical protein